MVLPPDALFASWVLPARPPPRSPPAALPSSPPAAERRMLRRPLPPSRGTAAPPRVARAGGAVRTAKGGLNERAKAARPRTAASKTADADRGDDDGRLAPVDVTIGGCGLSFSAACRRW